MKKVRLPIMDALVAFIPDGEEPSAAMNAYFATQKEWRCVSASGGRVMRAPFHGGKVPAVGFKVEPGGWGHEQCHECSRLIRAGAECWERIAGTIQYICMACRGDDPATEPDGDTPDRPLRPQENVQPGNRPESPQPGGTET